MGFCVQSPQFVCFLKLNNHDSSTKKGRNDERLYNRESRATGDSQEI